MDLSIKPIKTSKDKITQPELAIANIIPKLGSSIIFCGRSGRKNNFATQSNYGQAILRQKINISSTFFYSHHRHK